MKILIGNKGDVEVILSFKDQDLPESGLLKSLRDQEIFKSDLGETQTQLAEGQDHRIFLGLGKKEDLSLEAIKEAFFKLGRQLMKLRARSARVNIDPLVGFCNKETAYSISEGLLQSEYAFEKYLTEKKIKPSLEEFYLDFEDFKEDRIRLGIDKAQKLIEGIFLARDLTNEPAMVLTPEELARRAQEELEGLGVKVRVLGQKEIEDLGMEAFLAVSKGSDQEPKFIIMEWLKGGDQEVTALVGKGLTYDSGGYSIKPSDSMATMFSDMAGAGAVIGSLKSIALAGLEKNVVGLVAACENLISGRAYKPGDIISSMSKKTIEVDNTDAEGRLTLADALYYAATVVKADRIIDLATLTGACMVALGDITTGAVDNNEDLAQKLIGAGEKAGEPIWAFPKNPLYKDMIKSQIADLTNTSAYGPGAGAITAGLFLGEFVGDTPWIHLDIAGPSYLEKSRNYLPKGATGIPVNTLFNFIEDN